MAQKAIDIPEDLQTKFDGPDAFKNFDDAFRKVIVLPAESVRAEKKPKQERPGRPRKSS